MDIESYQLLKTLMLEGNDDSAMNVINAKLNEALIIRPKILPEVGFGIVKEPYSETVVQGLLGNESNVEQLKAYLSSYFTKSCDCVLMWNPTENKYVSIGLVSFRENYLRGIEYDKVWSARKWFFSPETSNRYLIMDPSKPLIYDNYINLFMGLRYKFQNNYDYTAEHSSIQLIISHIYTVLANSKQETFEYIMQWISRMFRCERNRTCLYLKSGQGTGKSVFVTFLQHCLGAKVTYVTEDTSDITGNFNESLAGKVLCCLEEPPSSGSSEWRSLAKSLKQKITGEDMVVKEKYKNKLTIKNITNYIINTNENAVKIDVDDRRFVALDVSHVHVGNREYFRNLVASMKLCTNGFFNYTVSIYDPKWNCDDIPATDTKEDLVIEAMNPVVKFIKESNYWLEGIDEPFSLFYDNYSKKQSGKPLSKVIVGKQLRSLGIPDCKQRVKNINGKDAIVKYIKFTQEDIMSSFSSKGFVHDTDDIPVV